MGTYDGIYILGNLFMTYVIHKYMHVFYSSSKISQTMEYLSYMGYFLIITTTYVLLKIPIIVITVNLLVLFILTLIYEGSLKKSILSVAVIFFSLMITEILITFLTSFLKLNFLKTFQCESGFGIIVIRLSSLVIVLLAQGFKNVKYKVPMLNIYWMSLLTVPLGTVVILFTIFNSSNVSSSMLLICMSFALAINLITFYLYDKISSLLANLTEQRLVIEQSRFYEHQVQMMESYLENIRILRHDLKNKLSPLYSLAQAGQSAELLKQLSELTSFYGVNEVYINSGNNTIDSIVNFKLSSAKKLNISISTDILIPEKLPLPTFDIAVVLGNLLDNAIDAVSNVNERWINIKMSYSKGRLLIEISNSHDGKLKKVGEKFITSKADKENHGYGLKSVQAVLKKYDGAIQFSHNSERFTVRVLLYLNS